LNNEHERQLVNDLTALRSSSVKFRGVRNITSG